MTNAVTTWFGDQFSLLHPTLQQLHKKGGQLKGTVIIEHGRGLAGIIGRRLGKKLGLPCQTKEVDFQVHIMHSGSQLFWNRRFANQHMMNSTFSPVGNYPQGYWHETTGKLRLELGVEIRDGGWYWVQRKIFWGNVSLPLWLFPKSYAYKKIQDGLYHFAVVFSLPIIGKLLSYSGDLSTE